MPKFYKQNKKRIDPRYFLDEILEEENEPDFSKRTIYVVSKKGNKVVRKATEEDRKGPVRGLNSLKSSERSDLKPGDKCTGCSNQIEAKNREDR